MDITIIAESNGNELHPVTSQLVGAASTLGGTVTVLCPGGIGEKEASEISGVAKVVSLKGDCFSSFDSFFDFDCCLCRYSCGDKNCC